MDPSKGKTERVNNEQGEKEVKVDTVDYRSPAGDNKEPVKENVEVLHEINDGGASSEKTGAPGFVEKATAAVAGTFQSAKDAVSGKPKDAVSEKPKDAAVAEDKTTK